MRFKPNYLMAAQRDPDQPQHPEINPGVPHPGINPEQPPEVFPRRATPEISPPNQTPEISPDSSPQIYPPEVPDLPSDPS